jgi:hypothetical protein
MQRIEFGFESNLIATAVRFEFFTALRSDVDKANPFMRTARDRRSEDRYPAQARFSRALNSKPSKLEKAGNVTELRGKFS